MVKNRPAMCAETDKIDTTFFVTCIIIHTKFSLGRLESGCKQAVLGFFKCFVINSLCDDYLRHVKPR